MTTLRLAICLFLVWLGIALAQSSEDIDLAQWDRYAEQVELSLGDSSISDLQLNSLRQELAEWRSRLQDAQAVNAAQIEALESQLSALGPVPDEGNSEPDAVAEERTNLNEELAEARAPGLRAEAAFARADALISQIDSEIRDRQTDALFELSETPLNPALWPSAAAAVLNAVLGLGEEIRAATQDADERMRLRETVPLAIGLVVLAGLLIARGPSWIGRAQDKLVERANYLGADAWRFLISLGEILLPVLGLTVLIGAVRISGLLGPTGVELAWTVNQVIFIIAVGRWLSRRVFPQRATAARAIKLSETDASEGLWLIRLLALLLAGYFLTRDLVATGGHSEDLTGVLVFPFLLLMAIMLYRVARLIKSAVTDPNDEGKFSRSLAGWLGQFVRLVAILGPIAAAVGYMNLASGLIVPTVLSLALIALLMTLHVVIRSAWGLSQRLSEDDLDSALLPILVSFSLVTLSLPLFALAWGARWTDISEIWTQFLSGVQFGETRIRPADFLAFLLVFAAGFALTRMVQGALRTSVLPRTRLDKGGQSALISGLGYVGLTLAALIAITAAGIDLSSLALVIGALGVGIGFGLQNIVNNFVSGIIMLIERPISQGDWVEVNGHMGIVKSISVRSTRVETFDRTDVIVPNGDIISGTVTNWTRGNSVGRVQLDVGVAYGTDTAKVSDILYEICEAHPMVALDPKPAVYFQNFGADSLEFRAYCILKDVNFILQVHSDLNHAIHQRFVAEGIEIPFAQRDIWLRNPEALKPADLTAPAKEWSTTPSEAVSPMEAPRGTEPEGD